MTLVLALPGGDVLAARLAAHLGCAQAALDVHRFPDGEQLVRVDVPVAGRNVILAGSLDHPDGKVLPLLFAAELLRELGAARVGLVAPYLPYMRQDARFSPGEAITSASFARLLSQRLDFLVTVEPHLHRWRSLSDIYSLAPVAASASEAIAGWLRREIPAPMLIGPDEESLQWVSGVARLVDAPFAVMRKTRRGDHDVRIEAPEALAAGRPVVILDDIVSSGGTLLAAADVLRAAGRPAGLCICVHALFDGDAASRFAGAGLRVVSCTTATHPSNTIDITPALARGLAGLQLP